MKDFIRIYSYVEAAVNKENRPVYCASQYEPVPESFPACEITELEHHKDRRYVTLAHNDSHYIRDFQITVYSNKQSGGLIECRDIMDDVEKAMAELAFIETYCGQQQNIDPTITRYVARFTATIGGADPMPTNTQGE